jgi:ATP-dependent Clp protease ATP-binding subunit ClpC
MGRMPYQHLDADSEAIVALANQIAHDDELEYVGTEHVLLAILRHNQGTGARVLHEFGIDEARARKKIQEIVQHDKEDTWVFGRLPGTPHFRNVIALAIDEATQLEAKKIGSEHLLLALLREKDSTGQRALHKMGVTLTNCRERVLKLLSQ